MTRGRLASPTSTDRARRLYERHGFTHVSEDPIDVYLMRPAAELRAVGGAALGRRG